MHSLIRIPGMGYALGPPTDLELGVIDDDMPECVCGCPITTHADPTDMPCTGCACPEYREDEL